MVSKFYFVSIQLLLATSVSCGAIEPLCSLPSCAAREDLNPGFVESECIYPDHFLDPAIRCCLRTHQEGRGFVIGIDLRNCSLNSIPGDFFTKNSTWNFALLENIDLSGNDLANISDFAFQGMANLQRLDLPGSATCVGGSAAWWNHSRLHDGVLECSGQKSLCNRTQHECPEFSRCADNGPGFLHCSCLSGQWGYKCLKKGTFPFANFYSILCAATVLLSGFLWFTQRRHVLPSKAHEHKS